MQTRVIAVLVSVQQVQDVWIIHGKQVINVAFGEQECLCDLQGDTVQVWGWQCSIYCTGFMHVCHVKEKIQFIMAEVEIR